MTAVEFPATFSQFKEGSRLINEAKAPKWLYAKVKTKEFDISNDDRPKMAKKLEITGMKNKQPK